MVFSFQFSCLQIYLKAYRLSEFNFLFILKVANIRCFIIIAVEIFHNIIQPRTKETRRCLIFFHPGKNSINVDPSNIHTTWPWTHSGKRLCLCEIVCWWRKCRMCKNQIVEEQKHWRILHENDTKRRIQQALCKN